MSYAITITVRLKSSRLPKKALSKIKEKSLIEHLIERLKRSKKADRIILCTSTSREDDELIPIAEKMGILSFRGHEDDVLVRLRDAAKQYGAEFIVSCTGDNPLVDPFFIDEMIAKYRETNADFVSAFGLPPGSYAYGLKVRALQEVCRKKKETDTEIWGPYFTESNLFLCVDLPIPKEYLRQDIRLTVDHPEDLRVIEQIYEALYTKNPEFTLRDVISFLDGNPHIRDLNKHIVQRKASPIDINSLKEDKAFRIGGRKVGPGQPCFIIAEAGCNHNGDLAIAKKLIDAAASAKADAVKFQTFRTEELVTKDAPKADYQKKGVNDTESYHTLLKGMELSEAEWKVLSGYAKEKGILFLSTPHSGGETVALLEKLGVPVYKIGSGDLTNLPFLAQVAQKGKPMIVGTGMATIEDAKEAISTIRGAGNQHIALLHGTTSYPCPPEEVNLRAMDTLQKETGTIVGYSDHTLGIDIAVAAAARGAAIIEKHFTLDRSMPGPDHKASLEPDELKAMVTAVRKVEEALGSGEKKPTEGELRIAAIARKSIVARAAIRKGETITEAMLMIKRPGTGIPPKGLPGIIGRKARQDIREDTILTKEMIR